MKPALTQFEWEHGYERDDLRVELRSGGRVGVTAKSYPLGGTLGNPRDIHALAALCLHGQTFGFTREDVRELHAAIGSLESRRGAGQEDELRDLAVRIKSLLPPEDV